MEKKKLSKEQVEQFFDAHSSEADEFFLDGALVCSQIDGVTFAHMIDDDCLYRSLQKYLTQYGPYKIAKIESE